MDGIYVHQSKVNGPITLKIYSVNELESNDLQELFKSYGHLISHAFLSVNSFSKSELEKVKSFLDESQLKHIIIDASFCTNNSRDLLNMDTFEAICQFNDSNNGVIAIPNKNGGFDLSIDQLEKIKSEDIKELLGKYKYTVGKVIFKNCDFDASELEDIMGFSNEYEIPLLDISIDAGRKCSIYKDGVFTFDNRIDISTFDKICKLNEKGNGICSFRINRSSDKGVNDTITIDRINLYDVTDYLDITVFEEDEIDSECIVTLPNRENNHYGEYDSYDISTFQQIMQKLHEITDDIDPNISDLKKFAIIYDRIGRYISYDNSISGISETDDNYRKSRNLENGLLKGKCICEGYAEILMNALKIVGIENTMVFGEVLVKTEDLEMDGFQVTKTDNGEMCCLGIDKNGNRVQYVMKKDGLWSVAKEHDGKYENNNGHVWNRVTIDGETFYADVTWDNNLIKSNYVFQHIQSQDEIEQDKKVLFQTSLYKVEGLSKEKKDELVAYQFELAHEREFERKMQIERKFNNISFGSCLYMMSTSLYDAKGKFTFTQKMLETLVASYSLENVIEACHKINNPQLENRINELLEKMLKEQPKEKLSQMTVFKRRPTELPYSKNRIAEGVSRAGQIADKLLIAANSREEGVNIEQ